jgi:hypothetical protein
MVLRCRSATVSDEFDSLDATEKAATKAALNRCRAVAAKIESELRNKKSNTSLTSCRWQTFTRPLSTLPMSSDRKVETDAHSEVFAAAKLSAPPIIEGEFFA